MVVAVDEAEHLGGVAVGAALDHGRGQLREQQRGRRPVAVVQLVAHLQRLGARARRSSGPARSSVAASTGPSTSPIQRSRVSTSSPYAP